MKHSKLGYRCPDCKKFLPQSLDKLNVISCPTPECLFVGKTDSLKGMREPLPTMELLIIKNNVAPNISSILEVINDQCNTLQYTSVNCTVKQKTFVYQAFANLLKKFPVEMSEYLLLSKRGYGLQSKLFQEYVSILESSFPFAYKSGKKLVQVTSITDDKFNPFDGISKFTTTVEKSGLIRNKTTEIYIGNRKSYYCNPFYIGKLLDVVSDTGETLFNRVNDYSFSVIETNLPEGMTVDVTHLRIPSHYQVGILSHINRIKKSITESLKEKND